MWFSEYNFSWTWRYFLCQQWFQIITWIILLMRKQFPMDIRCTPVAPNVQPPDVQQCMCNNFWRVKVLQIGYNRFILYPHSLCDIDPYRFSKPKTSPEWSQKIKSFDKWKMMMKLRWSPVWCERTSWREGHDVLLEYCTSI